MKRGGRYKEAYFNRKEIWMEKILVKKFVEGNPSLKILNEGVLKLEDNVRKAEKMIAKEKEARMLEDQMNKQK